MEGKLKKISEKYNCKYKKQEGTYDLSFEIRNLPLKLITLEQENHNFKLIAKCEFLWGTSIAPSLYSGNTPDKYIFSISCYINDNSSIPNFHIMEHDFIRKLFFKRDLRIKSNDKLFLNSLSKNNLIKDVYGLCKGTAELSPVIECRVKDNNSIININYQSFELNTDILDKSIEFCNQLKNYKTKHNNNYI
jgi:hypothetical protein